MNREALDSLDKEALTRLVFTQAEMIAALNRPPSARQPVTPSGYYDRITAHLAVEEKNRRGPA